MKLIRIDMDKHNSSKDCNRLKWTDSNIIGTRRKR